MESWIEELPANWNEPLPFEMSLLDKELHSTITPYLESPSVQGDLMVSTPKMYIETALYPTQRLLLSKVGEPASQVPLTHYRASHGRRRSNRASTR